MSIDNKEDDYPSPKYAWYVVGVLTVAYIVSFIDRQIMSLMVVPIQRDLELNDFQLSLLSSVSFAIFYTFFGIPLGRLADTQSRRGLIFFGVTFWSLMTAGCGLTKKFWDLAIMRMGVGVGEATLSPAAYSLIADYFPPHRRSTAMSVYSMGIYIGSGMAFILGGLVVKFTSAQESFDVPIIGIVRSWQLVFFIVGLPGLLVAFLLLTVKEPVRRGKSGTAHAAAPAATIRETLAYVSDNWATFVCLNIGVSFVTLNSYASTQWLPAMFVRRFEWTQGGTGMIYGLIVGTFGTLGVVGGGWLADWWTARGRMDAPVRVAWMATLCNLPWIILYPLATTGEVTAVLLIPMVFFASMPFGVAPAAIQRMMPSTMRAQATSIYLFTINLIGMGIGPSITGWLTDNLFHDKTQVHRSLQIVGITSYICAAVLIGISLKSYRGTLDYLQKWTPPPAKEA